MISLLALLLLATLLSIVAAVVLVAWNLLRESLMVAIAFGSRAGAMVFPGGGTSMHPIVRRSSLILSATGTCLLIVVAFTGVVKASGIGGGSISGGRSVYDGSLASSEDLIIRPFQEGRAAVSYKLLWGYMDRFGSLVVPLNYSSARPFSEGLAAVSKGNDWGFIDARGREIIPFRFRLAADFRDGKARVVLDDYSLVVIDREGSIVGIESPAPFCTGV